MSAVPPAYNPPRQQSGNKVWLWVLLAVALFCILLMIGLFFAGKALMSTGMGLVSCMANGDLARKAVLAYAMEHDGKLPNAAKWQDDIRPYYERLYNKMQGDSDLKDAPEWLNFKIAEPGAVLECNLGGDKRTGFAYNSLVGGKVIKDLENPNVTVLIFETTSPGYNATGDPSKRNAKDPVLNIMGEKREWLDFSVEGEANPFDSNNAEFDYDIKPEDGLTPKTPGPSDSSASRSGAKAS